MNLRPTTQRTPDLREVRGSVEASEAIAEIPQPDPALDRRHAVVSPGGAIGWQRWD